MQGFKSFPDKTVINFEDELTGVVGPNGCGKSNIVDAIRWVLGEQSIKSLRGEKMTDIIFAGSEGRKGVSMAEVTLVFDNSNKVLNSEQEEIEVSRRIYSTEQEAEYLINRNQVRLKDVIDLILDTGLGKDSLSMISQGNISQFADAKPYDRRAIFEEAAGVAKYKKRKIESLNKLERTKDNLDRTYDILSELERQVSPLKRQARKAEIYKEKKARLQEIEIAVLVDEIKQLKSSKDEIEKSLFDLETQLAMQQTTIQVGENDTIESKEKLKEFDKEINSLQDVLYQEMQHINALETRKVEVDEKRKYALEQASNKEKQKEIKTMLDEAKFEYEDRLKRLESYKSDLERLNTNLEELAMSLAESSLKKDETNGTLRRIESRIEVLENLLKDPFSSQAQSGVKAIMDNKTSFVGVMGVVGQQLRPLAGYEEALASSLAGSIYHIVTTNEESSRKAISFLKKNRSGRATFLPLTVLKDHDIKYEDEVIAKNTDGYIGTMDQFCECDSEYDLVRYGLLGNVLLTDNLENANNLASLLKYNYKIVTMDGDVVNKGGSMTGGKVRNEVSIVTASSELEKLIQDRTSYLAEKEINDRKYSELDSKKDKINSDITEKRIALAQLEPILEAKKAKFDKLQSDYNLLSPESNEDVETYVDSLVTELSNAYLKRDEVNAALKTRREDRMKLSADIDRKDQQIRQIRKSLDETNSHIRQISSDKAANETKLESDLLRLSSEYSMTYEYALENVNIELEGNERNEVVELRQQIENLGNVNMDAPEEFNEVNERYEFLKKNYDDLVASRDKILDTIDEMDAVMKEKFMDTFNKINKELPDTINKLFGGGKAKLVLEDESDVLNSGIDIDIQPVGKSIKSIRLFSGGEKSLIALCVLFTILKIKPVPLVVFDEVEAALDQANVERFAKYIKEFSKNTQFIVITHRPGTMAQCDVLYGVTMQHSGVSNMLKVKLVDAIEMADKEESQLGGEKA